MGSAIRSAVTGSNMPGWPFFFFFFSLSVIAFFFIFPFLRPTIPFLLHQEGFKYPKDDALFKAEVVRFQIALAFKSEWT